MIVAFAKFGCVKLGKASLGARLFLQNPEGKNSKFVCQQNINTILHAGMN